MQQAKLFIYKLKETVIILFVAFIFLMQELFKAIRKHYTATALILILSLNVNAQPFAGIEAGNKGAGINIGYLGNNIEVKAGTNMSLYRATTPALFYGSLGYQIKLTNNEEDNWSLVPSIGYSYSKHEDFTEWNRGGEIIKVETFKPKYTLEIGKDKHIGRIYANANYAGYAYFNIGIRAYIK